MDIPYVVKLREDTNLYNAKVGIWLFLASEVMLFGALFSSYILLRVGAPAGTWPHGLLNIPIGTFNTTVLITSSITVVMAWASLKMGNFGKFRFYQAITVVILEVIRTKVLTVPTGIFSQPCGQKPSGEPTRNRIYVEKSAPNSMTSEARNSQIPTLALYSPVSGRASTV